jgi:hypothetical protein
VASNQSFALSPNLSGDLAFGPMAAGPMGDVVVGYGAQTMFGAGCGTWPGGTYGLTECMANVDVLAFDPEDRLLLATSEGGFNGMESGFSGESTHEAFSLPLNGPSSCPTGLDGPPCVATSFLGADAAGNLFAQVDVTASPGVDFGLGTVSGTVLLHYGPNGALVNDTLPTAGGILAVGALGDLFYGTHVSGTVDEGCGTVGTAGASSTVLTERDATGACLWSKALPTAAFALDPSQNTLLATTFSGTIDFGGGPLTSKGTSDLAIAKLDPSGNLVWSKSFGASGASVIEILAQGATNTGGLTLVAVISGAVDFGCGAVVSRFAP